MQPVLFALLLAALHLHVPALSSAPPRERVAPAPRRRSGRVRSAFGRVRSAEFPLRSAGRRSVHRDVTGAETTNFVSIFDLRRKRFLCQEYTREQHSLDGARAACLFEEIWVDLGGSWRLLSEETRGLKAKQGSHGLSSSAPPWKKLPLRPLVSRQRRGDPVNPSDPLQSESHPSNPAQDHREPDPEVSEQDQAEAVSKETITSCDDPLKVLHSSRPVSPIKTNIAERAEQD